LSSSLNSRSTTHIYHTAARSLRLLTLKLPVRQIGGGSAPPVSPSRRLGTEVPRVRSRADYDGGARRDARLTRLLAWRERRCRPRRGHRAGPRGSSPRVGGTEERVGGSEKCAGSTCSARNRV
jgi:hypothetical protein